MNKKKLIRLIIGAVILILAILLENKTTDSFLTLTVFFTSYLTLGADVIWRAIKNIFKGQIFDENFLMSLATCGAFAIGESTEAVGVMLFYQIGEAFQEMAVEKSKKSISDLMDIRPDYANLITESDIKKVSPDTINVGDFILVKPGEKIPLDGIITEGKSFLDTQALTGESVPRSVKENDEVLSGCVNQSGVLKIKVNKLFFESTVSKIINLVENASEKKAKTENFITTFAKYYTPAVVLLAVLLATLPSFIISGFTFNAAIWSEWLHRSLVFLVISCPCALVLSIPMSFFAGIGKAAKNGILIKGGNFLEALNNLEILVCDKTGTLTKGVFNVTNIYPAEGYTENDVLELASYAESYSNHPIAKSILKTFGKEIDKSKLSNYKEIAGLGVSVEKDGKTILAGNEKLMEQGAERKEIVAGTKVYVAISTSSSFNYVGCITISDVIKPDAKQTISLLNKKNIKTVMLTGDNSIIANQIADVIGINEVYAELLPQEKVNKIEYLNTQKTKSGKLAFIGDGINDAPSLAIADIGIAMGGLGSDAAIEAADIVLMTDEISKLPVAIKIARFTRKIVWQNIIFALGVKIAFMILGAFGIAGMWEAIFADVGVALLAVSNSMRIVFKKSI